MKNIAAMVSLILVGLLLLLVWAEGPEPVSTCIEISTPGNYYLSQDIVGPPTIDASPLDGKACIKIFSSDVLFDCSNHWITTDPEDSSDINYGVLIMAFTNNVTVKNCGISGYRHGLYAFQTSNSFFSNNNLKDNLNSSITINGGGWNNISSNNISNSHTCMLVDSEHNQILNNYLSGCTFFSINLDSGSNDVIGNTVAESQRGITIFEAAGERTNNNRIVSNTLFGGSASISVGSSWNLIKDNLVYNSQWSCIDLIEGAANNGVTNNTVYNCAQGESEVGGIRLSGAKDNVIFLNNVFGNKGVGIVLIGDGATGNRIEGNKVYGNNPENAPSFLGFLGSPLGGIAVIGVGNNITNNDIYQNNGYGIGIFSISLISDSYQNNINSNNIYNNSAYGIYIDSSGDNYLSKNEIYNQRTGHGIYIRNSAGSMLENNHYYRNNVDFFINATKNINIALVRETFDAPSGEFDNYTVLSINDTLKAIDNYAIKWATNTSTIKIPAGTFTLGKFLNMSTTYALLEIDSITWHWTDKDVQDADEKSIQLWNYTSAGWSLVENFTLNASTNSLNVSNVNATFYGLVYANATPADCTYLTISINFTPSCIGNEVMVSAGGSPLSLADVRVMREGFVIASGQTDSAGKFSFNGTGGSVDIYVEKAREPATCYSVPGAGKFTVNLKSPADCGKPECTANSDCPSGQVCTNNRCAAAPTAPECTNDSDCQNNKTCQGGKCVEKQPPLPAACTSNENCTAEQYCSAGMCIPVATGACGHIVNHAWVAYECCADPDCAEGGACEGNKCVAKEEYSLAGEDIGYLGQMASFTALLNSNPLPGAQVKVTMPDGSFEILTSDPDGNVSFPITETGAYVVDLMVNDNIESTLVMTSLSSISGAGGTPITLGLIAQAGVILVFIVLILAVLAFLFYYFFMAGKGAGKPVRRKRRKGKRGAPAAEIPEETEGEVPEDTS